MKYYQFILLLTIFIVIFLVWLFSEKENYNNSNNSNPIITFVIPSIGRPTLKRTVESLKKLNVKNWKAIIIFDRVEPNLEEDDPRIKMVKLEKKLGEGRNSAGNVRNFAYQFIDTPWIGFVDDDDTLNPYYIDHLQKESNDSDLDVIIFRMIYEGGLVLPPPEDKDFEMNKVGISFCLKSDVAKQFLFVPNGAEDFYLLDNLRANQKKILMSEYIGYNVGF